MNDLEHPINAGEVVNPDDVAAIKRALDETQRYLDQPEVRRMYRARADLQARLGELEPTAVPAHKAWLSDAQREMVQCPRCGKHYQFEDSESVQTQQDGISGGDQPALGAGEPGGSLAPADSEHSGEGSNETEIAVSESSPSPGHPPVVEQFADDVEQLVQETLLPEGPRTVEQEAALGIDIFGERDDPEPAPSSAQATGEAVDGESAASTASLPLDWVVEEAGKVVITKGGDDVKGKTVAQVVEENPNRCLAYINGGGKDQKLIAALTTYLYAVRPDLMEATK